MRTIWRHGLGVVTAAGLAIDATTHLRLAHNFTGNSTGTVNEGVLFRIEAAAAIAAAVLVLLRPRALPAAVAALVAGGGAALLLLYRYVDVGKIGPVPNMYEPVWYGEKELSLLGELVALAAALVLLVGAVAVGRRRRRVTLRR